MDNPIPDEYIQRLWSISQQKNILFGFYIYSAISRCVTKPFNTVRWWRCVSIVILIRSFKLRRRFRSFEWASKLNKEKKYVKPHRKILTSETSSCDRWIRASGKRCSTSSFLNSFRSQKVLFLCHRSQNKTHLFGLLLSYFGTASQMQTITASNPINAHNLTIFLSIFLGGRCLFLLFVTLYNPNAIVSLSNSLQLFSVFFFA